MIPCKPLRTWPPAPKDCFSEVVPKCPMAHLIPNFPCPGPQRHRLHYYEDHPTAPSGKGEAICRVGAFSNLRFTKCPQYPAGNLKLLEDTLMSISYENVDGVVQLGGVLDTTNVETKGEVDDIIAHLAHSFNKTYSKVSSLCRTQSVIRSYGMSLVIWNQQCVISTQRPLWLICLCRWRKHRVVFAAVEICTTR